ncbi:unnamed protein product [Sphagnum jensenii]|uniref:Uncharacterized protein n=1 Tax=Sphagnum jensenii TaxID=128206 RepID=A0ABP1AL25_9BRYO
MQLLLGGVPPKLVTRTRALEKALVLVVPGCNFRDANSGYSPRDQRGNEDCKRKNGRNKAPGRRRSQEGAMKGRLHNAASKQALLQVLESMVLEEPKCVFLLLLATSSS